MGFSGYGGGGGGGGTTLTTDQIAAIGGSSGTPSASNLFVTQADLKVDPNLSIPQGRLYVPPAYMQTSSDTAFAMTTATCGIAIGFTPDIDISLSSCSIWVNAVSGAGNMTLGVYSDNAGAPGTLLNACGTLNSGAGAGAWVRGTWANYQLVRGVPVWFVAFGQATKNFSLSYRRRNTVHGSSIPYGCKCLTTTDGSTWAACVQNYYPGMWNVVLNSTTNHTPQLMYGRYSGSYSSLYKSSAWDVATIPAAGIILNCEALAAETNYYVYLRDTNGTLGLEASTTGLGLQDGKEVKSGDSTGLFVGVITPSTRSNSQVGPWCVQDRMQVWNRYNQVKVSIGKSTPYYDLTSTGIGPAGSWRKAGANGDEYKISMVGGPIGSAIDLVCSGGPESGNLGMIWFSMDDSDGLSQHTDSYVSAAGPDGCSISTIIPFGLHYFYVAVSIHYGSSTPTAYWHGEHAYSNYASFNINGNMMA